MSPVAPVHGREDELAALRAFVADGSAPALFLTGGAGAGKTALWEAGCALAADAGQRVLATRARDAEASLAFVGLGDLLDGVERAAIDALPAPQRAALDVALLLAEPDGPPPEPRAVGLAVVGVLRELAASGPVLIAVDDVQWLDAASADVLSFAARRLAGIPVRLLVTERAGADTRLVPPSETLRIEVGPVTAATLALLLHRRMDLRLPRPQVLELHRVSQGNPLYALEVGRILVRDGVPGPTEPLPHPDVEELVDTHIADLSDDVRRALLAAALSAQPRRPELEALVGEDALHAALIDGVLVADGERLRPAHPLLGSAAARAAAPAELRAMHAQLAGVAADDHRRAAHQALAAGGPDEQLAAYLASAAGRTAARGAAHEGVFLAEHALRLCPDGAESRPNRILELAEHLARAGRSERLGELLGAELEALPTPADRARGHLLLCDGAHVPTIAAFEEQIELALAEGGDDPTVRARALARRATAVGIGRVERLAEAEAWAEEGHLAAAETWPDIQHEALHTLVWIRALRGGAIDDLVAEAATIPGGPPHPYRSAQRLVAVQAGWRGRVDEAREQLAALMEAAREGGWGSGAIHLEQIALEIRAGDCITAARELEAYDDGGRGSRVLMTAEARLRALLAAATGDQEAANSWAGQAIATAEWTGVRWDLLESRRAIGVAALAAGDPGRAAAELEDVWTDTYEQGVGDLGAFAAGADLVEALVAVDRIDDAAAVLACLGDLAAAEDHPWARVSAQRGHAQVDLAAGRDEDAAAEALAAAAASYTALGLHHDAARTLLTLGRAQRRRRKWGDARRALEDAAESFAGSGAAGWAAVARGELDRVGARRPPSDPDELTPAERRVVELAAAGHANKAIAQTLVVTVSTVEAHLTRAYGKLGVTSRTQLAERIGWSKSGGFTN